MKGLLFCFFAFFITCVFAQEMNFSLKDSLNNEPIPFTTILLLQGGKPFFADYCSKDGIGVISENKQFDAVTFSCVGYKDKTISKADLKAEIVYLAQKSYQLDEVAINNRKVIDTLLLGEFYEKKKGTLPLYIQNEVAVFFENNFDKEVALTTFLFKTWRVKHKTALRLRLYKKRIFNTYYFSSDDPKKTRYYYDTVIPGDDLFDENIIIYLDPKKMQTVKIDLSSYNIEMPKDGIFVSLECLGYFDENNNPIKPDANRLSELEMHATIGDNYCVKLTNITRFWVNQNQHYKIDYKYFNNTLAPKSILKEPTFGLKVITLE